MTHLVIGNRLRKHFEAPYGKGTPAGTATVFRNPQAFPRARLAGRPFYVEGERGASAALDQLGPMIHSRLIVEDPTHRLPEEAEVTGTARIVRDEPERVEIATEASMPSYLVLADTFDPGWTARVDGHRVPIRPAYLAFRAVFLPRGPHTVVFTYTPAGFPLGLGLTLACLALGAVLCFWPRQVLNLDPTHQQLNWPRHWVRWGVVAFVAIVLYSTVKLSAAGHLGLHRRWQNSLHHFTWGAGILAIEPPRAK